MSRTSSDPGWRDAREHVGAPAIVLENATKRFPGLGRKEFFTALDSIGLTVDIGSFVALIGSNGAGKSTLLSVLMGTLFLDEGTISVVGRDVTDEPSWRRASEIALVRQNPEHNVLAGLTIEENFALSLLGPRGRLNLGRYDRDRVRAAAADTLRQFGMGLEDRLTESTRTLSGGQRQAIAVAMAAVRGPKVLLLDEHLSALDPTRARIVGEMTETIVRSQKMTTVMITHDLGHAMRDTDRVLMMHRGRIVMDISGKEKEMMELSDLTARFEETIGEALPDNLLLRAS